jgi:hypothetical protein
VDRSLRIRRLHADYTHEHKRQDKGGLERPESMVSRHYFPEYVGIVEIWDSYCEV